MDKNLFLKLEKYLSDEAKLRFKPIDELQQEYEIWEQTNLQLDGDLSFEQNNTKKLIK